MDLSIIIVNYNVKDFLENALTSIGKALDTPLRDGRNIRGEVFVVDNASDDGSVELVTRRFPKANLIENKENLGFARANNLAIQQAQGEYVLLINPDTVVQEDTFKVMIDFFNEHPAVGAAGCKILNPDGTLQLACRRSFPSPWVSFAKAAGLSAVFPRSRFFGQYNLTYLDPDQRCEVDAVSGSFLMVRRKVIEAVGGLDENFFMYGEDLDWCYRIQKAGWKIYYVPETQIIHYKGMSAKRSDFDEVKTFYEAMHLFVEKHLSGSIVIEGLLRLGIGLRRTIAFASKFAKPIFLASIDFLLVDISLLLAGYVWLGRTFSFPSYAYWVVFTFPALIFIVLLFSLGIYTTRKFSLARAALGIGLGFLFISSLTYFFKDYAFSRALVIISSGLSLVFLLLWRAVARIVARGGSRGGSSLFGRRTLIVGVGASGQEILRKLRLGFVGGYDVVGFVDVNRLRLGEKVEGVEILGSVENIARVIRENRVTDVIFSADTLSYNEILSVISRSRDRAVNFRLVPSSLEVIIGKTHIDQLADIPLLDIEYKIDRAWNRFSKRAFDILVSLVLLVVTGPIISLTEFLGERGKGRSQQFLKKLIAVTKGEMSLVGPPAVAFSDNRAGSVHPPTYIGKPGLTGLAQINPRLDLTNGEVDRYNLYYAKNQSLWLDAEILGKSFFRLLKNSKGGPNA
jgi:GT2 family glycosyltransferase/lipopolysaccharide/colanic/teichoic acid biosynthesis glycosyltransferase